MTGTISNEHSFLNKLAKQLGRETPQNVTLPKWRKAPQHQVLQHKSQDELLAVLQQQCKSINTHCVQTTTANMPTTLQTILTQYGEGSIMAWQDTRLADYGAMATLQQQNSDFWDYHQGHDTNIAKANEANVGVAVADYMLAESGTAVLLSNADRGRAVNFLPQKSIIIVPKSAILPRMTQATNALRQQLQSGEPVPSCINFISGPSNSADIEMILVVGVHGPMQMTYIIVEDQ